MLNRIFSSIFLLILCSQIAEAQLGSLKGRVLGDNAQPFAYASIHLKGTGYGTMSNEEGYFEIEKIKAGSYTLQCSGHCVRKEESIIIEDNKETFLTIRVQHTLLELDSVVVTATRTARDIADLPIPVKLIGKEQIQQMGSLRLNEVLAEQTGLAIVNDHGTGVQMQGFAPEYTMILLNGEPMVGRTAGTFNLNRITVNDINRIEIVKGPSSSLYGSEALAGVINIITDKPKDKFTGHLKTRYGSNNTFGISADATINHKKLGVYLFADRYRSSGYKLNDADASTVPPYHNYTYQTTFNYKFRDKTDLNLSTRLFTQEQTQGFNILINKNTNRLVDSGKQYDWNINPVLSHYFNEKNKLTARYYSTKYRTQSSMVIQENDSIYDQSFFAQTFNRPELQYDKTWNSNNTTTLGVGSNIESVNSTRYSDKQNFYNLYLYAQHDFSFLKRFNMIAGFRFDNHSVYGSQLNPKLSAKYKVNDKISVRGSVGRGFKAPDFRQLYLNFSNPVEGYSVFGSEEVIYQIASLQQQQQISQILIEPSTLQAITAEHSVSYNAGWIIKPINKVTWQANLFHNDIKDMIATTVVALKTNGQSVYSYSNIANVYTQGFETDINYQFHRNMGISAGYQYLVAKDKQVVSDIKDGKYYQRDPETFATIKITEKEYGGLNNRSRNMFNAKLFYLNNKKGHGANIRFIYRGRYGSGDDKNGNLILDSPIEYVNGYWLTNLAINKKFLKSFTLQAGIDNLFDYTNSIYIPTLPGRIYYLSLDILLNKQLLTKQSINNE